MQGFRQIIRHKPDTYTDDELQHRIQRLSETQKNVLLLIAEEMDRDNRQIRRCWAQVHKVCGGSENV